MAEKSNVAVTAAEREDQIADTKSEETGKVSDFVRKLEALELEKGELVKNDADVTEKEDLGLKFEKEELVKKVEEDAKSLDLIVERASDLESNVLGLRHEANISISHGDEVRKIEKENASMKEDFLLQIADVNKAKALIEAKFVDLESRLKGREEEFKVQLVLKESEIISLKKKVAELKDSIYSSGLKLTNEKVEKKALEDALSILQKKVEEAERMTCGVKRIAVNGVVDRDAAFVDEGSNKQTTRNLQWALGAGAAAVFIGGIVVVFIARIRR